MHSTHTTVYQSRAAQSASAGWSYSYEQPSSVAALPGCPGYPGYFFDSEISVARVCPETALLYAVLEDAFVCFQNQFKDRLRPIQRKAAREAEEWFFSDDTRELFSFLSVCMALGLEPGFIRKKLNHRRQTRVKRVVGTI